MNFRGLYQLQGDADAGSGRRVWMAANLNPTDRVVDLGGTGGMLASWHPNVTALDDLSGFGPGHRIEAPTFLKGDVQSLPFHDQQFDVAVLAEVLEHVPQPVTALREAGRVASRVLITTPCEQRWTNGLAFRVSGHCRFYTTDILAKQLRDAGLDGDIALLEFGGGWSFFVAAVGRTTVEDRFGRAA